MAIDGSSGVSALDRMRDRLSRTESKCPECGSRNAEWDCERDGTEVLFERTCPDCGAVADRTLRMGR